MSFIRFESSKVKEKERADIRNARELVLQKAEEDYSKRKKEKEKAKLRGDDQWMLPSVESKLNSSEKMGKKRKKKKKHKKKKESSSDSSSESEDEWVVKDVNIKEISKKNDKIERDEWMSLPGVFPCVSRDELRKQSGKSKQREEEKEKNRKTIESLGQSDRELNPYWKDGGTGLPPEKIRYEEKSKEGTVVGDRGVGWLHRALERVKEQAKEQGRSLEDVASERWGSLHRLQSMIAEAEKKSAEDARLREKPDQQYSESRRDRSRQSDQERDKYHKRYEDEEATSKRSGSRRLAFKKPNENDEHNSRSVYKSSHSSTGNWKKKIETNVDRKKNETVTPETSKIGIGKSSSSSSSSSSSEEEPEDKLKDRILTDKEMNDLAAKLLKAEILGNKELEAELKEKLEKARVMRRNIGSEKKERSGKEEEVVILTKTDARGFVHPVKEPTEVVEPKKGRRRKKMVETYSGGKRVKYYADDDKYSLKDLFEQEKTSSVDNQNAAFMNIMAKADSQSKNDYDGDDGFLEKISIKEHSGRSEVRQREKAIKQHKTIEKSLDNCPWCLGSKTMMKHLIVAMGHKVYLCLPPHQSLTEGHCIVVPNYHVSCSTQIDEDVWDEIQIFRKSLTRMFNSMDQDVIFYESARKLNKFPHMILECVPMPKETGDLAPIYFKKAILECEAEWSNNKKVIDISKKDVRHSVPKGLPYFAVDFGNQGGFAHVIEDEQLFPINFAQEIIGGMLDLDHSLWRKHQKENFDKQRQKVLHFAKWWKPFDCTSHSSSSSESD